jgi:hypothetical protein
MIAHPYGSWSVTVLLGVTLAVLDPAIRADEPAQSASPNAAAFKKAADSYLDQARVRIRRTAEPVLEWVGRMNGTDSNVLAQEIAIQGAQSAYLNAQLERQVKEIGVLEYEQGIYPQQVATAEGEARLAESDLKRSADQLAYSSGLLERIRKVATESLHDTLAVVQFEAMVKTAQLSQRKAEMELEQAKNKLKLLRDYEKPRRMKELGANVEKARAEELAKKQTLQLERDKLTWMKKRKEGPVVLPKYRAILQALADGLDLEDQIRGKLSELVQIGDAQQAERQKQILALHGSLESKLVDAERRLDDLRFAVLAGDIRRFAARQEGNAGAAALPGNGRSLLERLRKIAPEDRAKLKNATPEEQRSILKKAGFTDAEIQQKEDSRERRKSE